MFLAMSRAMLSVPPPAAKGTISVMARAGQGACAAAASGTRARHARAAFQRMGNIGVSPWVVECPRILAATCFAVNCKDLLD
jgi:hypothetical protein